MQTEDLSKLGGGWQGKGVTELSRNRNTELVTLALHPLHHPLPFSPLLQPLPPPSSHRFKPPPVSPPRRDKPVRRRACFLLKVRSRSSAQGEEAQVVVFEVRPQGRMWPPLPFSALLGGEGSAHCRGLRFLTAPWGSRGPGRPPSALGWTWRKGGVTL